MSSSKTSEILPIRRKTLYSQSTENLTVLLLTVSQTCPAKSIKFIESYKQLNKYALIKRLVYFE